MAVHDDTAMIEAWAAFADLDAALDSDTVPAFGGLMVIREHVSYRDKRVERR